MPETPQVILWFRPGKSSCVSESDNYSSNSPLPIGTKFLLDGLVGEVIEGRKYEGFYLHRSSVLVTCNGIKHVWFIPTKPAKPALRPVPKKKK